MTSAPARPSPPAGTCCWWTKPTTWCGRREFASPGYALVESLAARTPGLLLLTATPEQLGLGGHFARLRLLDPARYTDLDAYRAQSRGYQALSALAERLLEGQSLTTDDMATLAGLFPGEEDALVARLGRIAAGDD